MGRISDVEAAVARGEWQHALDILETCGSDRDSAAGLELRAQAQYGNGGFEASITAWEDLHTLLIAQGDTPGAARAASMVAMFLMMDTGLMSAVRGWLRRAERLLDDSQGEVPAHALVAVVRGYERFMCGDMDAARTHSALAIELGNRLGVPPVVVIGRVCSARVRIFDGHVDEGLELLDEIAVDLMSGEVDPLTTGIMYCELICAAQGMALHRRASEWTEVMEQWRHGAAIGAISGRCRVHRAEMLRLSGPCDRAEEEALGACEELRPWMRREFGWPLVELGNIRLRKGDLAGADEAFMAAHEHAWCPNPGLALLRLEQGDVVTAAMLIADAIAHPIDIPSKERPPFVDLRRAPLLDAQVEVAAAAGDIETAQRATIALQAIADSYDSGSLNAGAALAHARLALLTGDFMRAIDASSAAVAGWVDVGAPFEAAVARTVLAEAHQRSGNTDRAQMEWRAAHVAFTTFGAVRWAERAQRTAVESLDATPRDQVATDAHPTSDEHLLGGVSTATFRRTGDTRIVGFGSDVVVIRDLKGLRYVERLLLDPGREFHVLDLVAVEHGSLPVTSVRDRSRTDMSIDVGAGLPVLDDAARAAYMRRLADIDDDIDDATEMNDLARLELAQRDREYLVAELARDVGIGGRHRSVGGGAERARTSVTRSVRYALDRLAEHHFELATHLGQSVHTGIYCQYTPDPLAHLSWDF